MDIGNTLPLWSIIPFAGMLLSIAIFPLVKGEWWEKHQLHVALFWSVIFLVPFTIFYGIGEAPSQFLEIIVLDYVPFIILLFGLFVVAGGIHIKGTIAGTTRNNVILLAIGTFLASWIGTTGAAMLLIQMCIRDSIRTNRKMEVVDKNGKPVPGLYSAGVDSADLWPNIYTINVPGGTNANNINSGRFASKFAAEYIGSNKGGSVSVSYTHLDVYKRQARSHPKATRANRFPTPLGQCPKDR